MSGGSSLSTTAGPSPLVASRRDRSTDFRTFAGEQDCGYAADPVTRAGDEGYLACKPWHRSLLPDRVSKTPESGGSPCDIVALSKAWERPFRGTSHGFCLPEAVGTQLGISDRPAFLSHPGCAKTALKPGRTAARQTALSAAGGFDLGGFGGRVFTKAAARSSHSCNVRSSRGGGSTKI